VYGALKLTIASNDISYLFLFYLLYQLRWQRGGKAGKMQKASRRVGLLLLHALLILSSLELSDKSLDNVDIKCWKHVPNNAVNHVHEVINFFDSLNFLCISLFDLQQQQSSAKARLRWKKR
jgi:hypothetical protein